MRVCEQITDYIYREKEAEKLYKIVCLVINDSLLNSLALFFDILPAEVSKIICDYINPCFDIRHDSRETNKVDSDIAIA